uniref:Putative histone H3.3 type 2 n=1 Tax=Culex tarsalis TaxID=7177 RepID=A0A1Q3F1R6_CULTA
MPRRGPSPRKMGPNKKGGPNSKNTRTPSPVAPPPPPPPPPGQSHQRPVSQRDVFDEMMGSEISSDNSSQEVTPALLVPLLTKRKSPRFQDTTGSVASDDSSLSGTTNVTSSSEAPPPSNNASRQQQQHRRKAPAPKKAQTAALKEIAKLQRHTNPVIPKLAFARLIREILMEYSHRELRITPESLMCLQESAEVFGVQLMEDAYRCTLHRDRITLMPKDMKLAVMLRKDSVML